MIYDFQISKTRKVSFKIGQPKVVNIGDGMLLVSAKVKAKDGNIYDAVLEIDSQSSGEHCGTSILLPDKIVSQSDKDFCKKLGTTKAKFFPYTYNYRPLVLPCADHHVDEETGWSSI